MNSMLATEPTAATEEKRTTLPPLETWSANERMRHVPPVEWMLRKLEIDLRSRINKLMAPFADLAAADPHSATIESEVRALGGAIDRLTVTAGGRRTAESAATTLPARIGSALGQAAASLRALEQTPFGQRNPYHTFDRSKAEPVYGALLAVICHVERLVPLVRALDPDIDEKLLA
jgi:hypothetical protein